MRSVEQRIKKLEERVTGGGKSVELYNYAGDLVIDARIIKMPTAHERGLAIVDGSRREIAEDRKLLDILRTGREGKFPEPMSDEDRQALVAESAGLLFIRAPNNVAEQILLGTYYKGGGV